MNLDRNIFWVSTGFLPKKLKKPEQSSHNPADSGTQRLPALKEGARPEVGSPLVIPFLPFLATFQKHPF